MKCKCGCGNDLDGQKKLWYSKACYRAYQKELCRIRTETPRKCSCGNPECNEMITGKASRIYASSKCYSYARWKVRAPAPEKIEDGIKDVYISRDGEKIRQISDNYSNILASPGVGMQKNKKGKHWRSMTSKEELLPCPNCKSKPRITGTNASGPVKIRCSNKKCELSQESAGVTFWQGIRRDFSEDQARQAFEQFQLSIEPLKKIIKRQAPVIAAAADVYNDHRPFRESVEEGNVAGYFKPFARALSEYTRNE